MNVHSMCKTTDKKTQIACTALQLIAERGIQETPMSEISKSSGIAMGTIYHHFKGKRELINYIYLDIKKQLGKVLTKGVEEGMKPVEKFGIIWRNLFDFYASDENVFRFAQQLGQAPVIAPEVKAEGKKYYQTALEFLEEGIATGYLKNFEPELMVETIHSQVSALVQLYYERDARSFKPLPEQALLMSWQAMAADGRLSKKECELLFGQ